MVYLAPDFGDYHTMFGDAISWLLLPYGVGNIDVNIFGNEQLIPLQEQIN